MKYSSHEDRHNKFRRLINKHFSHTSYKGERRASLMAFELWGGVNSEEMKRRLNELKKYDIKFEDVWIDAGWHGDCSKCDDAFTSDWYMYTGDWDINKKSHPDMFEEVEGLCKRRRNAPHAVV